MADLAERIDPLFKASRRADGREYSYLEVEEGTQRAVTGTYIWKLRSGKASDPGYRVLKALSTFFHVPVSYFFDDDIPEEYLEDMKLLSQLRDGTTGQIALRAADLDERGRQAVLDMIEYVRKAQGLDSTIQVEDDSHPSPQE